MGRVELIWGFVGGYRTLPVHCCVMVRGTLELRSSPGTSPAASAPFWFLFPRRLTLFSFLLRPGRGEDGMPIYGEPLPLDTEITPPSGEVSA